VPRAKWAGVERYLALGSWLSAASLCPMPKFLLPLFLFVILATLSGCSLFHKKQEKSTAHLYEGDAPTLRFNDKPESAGGAINPY